MTALHKSNLLFQSEQHPLVAESFPDFESFCLSLIHKKAYEEAAALADGATVLDVGCNTGYGAARVAETAKRVVGLDVSVRAVAAAQANYRKPNLEFLHISGERVPFEAACFDQVISFQVIEHVVDTHAYLSEIARVLRVDGIALFTTPNRCIRLEPDEKPWNRFHVREYAAEELADLLRQHFEQVEVQGLFATAPIYETELRRVSRARNRSRSRVLSATRAVLDALSLTETIKHLTGSLARVQRSLRPARDRAAGGGGSGDASYTEQYSTADLVYLSERLDQSLDLLAVCRRA